jgi:GAF domain-containing protein
MNQLRSPIVWRLLLWVLLLTLVVPIGAVMVFTRSDIHNFFTQQDQANLEEQARFLFSEINARPDESQQIVETFGNKNTSAFILDSNGVYLAHTDPQKAGAPATSDLGDNVLQQILNAKSADIDGSRIAKLITIAGKLPGGKILVVTLDNTERVGALDTLTNTLILQLVISLAIASLIGAGVSIATLLNPLIKLARLANDMGSGNYDTGINVEDYEGELAVLAINLKDLSSNIKNSLTQLEKRVAERTTDLEIARQQSERRARELQTIGEISGIIASEQRTETLLPLVTRLVSERFDFYHVGIFLVDETGQWAVLQAANSQGGQSMLARGHKLEVGATGIVGYVTKSGTPRIALDVGADSVFFNNPDLPATRSEMALPLNVRGQIIGALDVQSIRPGAFTEDDTNTLGVLADQIAISIENTRLFGRIQSTLAEVQSLYRQDIAKSWAKFAQDEGVIGYHKSLTEGKLINQAVDTDEIRQTMNRGNVSVFNADRERTESILVVPVKLRGQVIGVLNIKASKNEHQWSFDEIGLAEAVSERLALALENARLLQDSQNRAAKEQVISEITTKISGSINMSNILQTAVEELGHALPGSEVIIEFEQKNGNEE